MELEGKVEGLVQGGWTKSKRYNVRSLELRDAKMKFVKESIGVSF